MCVCVLWFVYCCFSLCYCLSLQLSIWIGLINHLIKYNWLRIVASCTTLVGVKTWTYIVLSRAKISLLYFPVFDTLRCERKGSMVIPNLQGSHCNSAGSIHYKFCQIDHTSWVGKTSKCTALAHECLFKWTIIHVSWVSWL